MAARADDFVKVRNALHASDTLYAYAATRADAQPLTGRGVAYRVKVADETWVVRRYRRGGAIASLLGDRYARLGTPRAWRELAVSETARGRGVRTPRVVAAAIYGKGPFLRSDLATEYVPDSEDLAAIGFGASQRSAAEKQAAFRAAGALVRELGQNGISHPDLNVRNILIRFAESAPEAWVLDLDRARATTGKTNPGGMWERLQRSLAKEARLTGRTLDPQLQQALETGYRG